ncbi:MAG: hypothetical protein PWR21_810 [Methanoculleus sp.]|nr:hypothetical protein [Methanoculleus sp.]MDK2989671.1 hypothetical protein [Methanoculleus sp.]
MAIEKEGSGPSIETVREPEFRVAYVDGVFGDLNPERGHLAFFYDVPELMTDPDGHMAATGVQRRIVIDLRMPPQRWVAMARWMMEHADLYEDWLAGKSQEEP